jgi:hypothetical protein
LYGKYHDFGPSCSIAFIAFRPSKDPNFLLTKVAWVQNMFK